MSADDAAVLSVLGVVLGGIGVGIVLWLVGLWKKHKARKRDDEDLWP